MAVYRDMDQQTLEREYDARATVASFDSEMDRYRQLSAESYAQCRVVRDLAYGDAPEERYDFFPAGPGAPVFVFVHGGYWRALGRAESAFMARALVAAGVAVAVVEYGLAPAVSLDTIVAQVRCAIAAIYRDAPRHWADPERLYICGSSAGAHLCAMAMIADWETAFDVPGDIIKGAVLVSGLFDLEPVRLCRPNTWLKLDEAAAARNSPLRLMPPKGAAVRLYWGAHETGEFKRQSRDFAALLRRSGIDAPAREIAERNHFDVITDLADPTSQMTQDCLRMML